jgi:hypothetical protein
VTYSLSDSAIIMAAAIVVHRPALPHQPASTAIRYIASRYFTALHFCGSLRIFSDNILQHLLVLTQVSNSPLQSLIRVFPL